MRRWFLMLAALILIAPHFAWARPMDGTLQRQLLALYSHFNQAVASGQLDEALTLRSTAVRSGLAQRLQTPKGRADYVAGVDQMAPDRLDTRHASVTDAGDKALLVVLAGKTTAAGQTQSELDLSFVNEGGAWKLGDVAVAPAPAEIQRCKDASYEAAGAYDPAHPVSLIGRIERVDFQATYTVVMVLSGNVESCVFLPSEAVMRQRGLDPATLQPYRVAEITGAPNRSNAQKVMIDNITVHEEQ
jgi:hypothetical protein